MSFVEVQFPTDISYGASGGPIFMTDVVATVSGHEQRNSKWSQSRAKYNVASGIKTEAQWQALIAFFRARRGMAIGFRFKDWSDYKAENQPLKSLGGNEYQLVKQYVSGAAVYEREISKPVTGTVKLYKIASCRRAVGALIPPPALLPPACPARLAQILNLMCRCVSIRTRCPFPWIASMPETGEAFR